MSPLNEPIIKFSYRIKCLGFKTLFVLNMKEEFSIDEEALYFNASYGVVPKYVREYHYNLLSECEYNPYKWFTSKYKEKVLETKHALSTYLNCSTHDFVIVDNSSSGANSVFNSLEFDSKSAIVVLETAYGLIVNLVNKFKQKYNLEVVVVPVNLNSIHLIPLYVNLQLVKLKSIGFNVKLVCVDHISSCPAVVMPVKQISKVCKNNGVPLFVDGAHALGQIKLDISELEDWGMTYWVSDTHKWFFSPKGSAVLWVTKEKQENVVPTIDCASIGSNGCTVIQNQYKELSEFESRFLYLGTKDYTPWISISGAIHFIKDIGGYDLIINRNKQIATWAQTYMSVKLDTECTNKDLIASMGNVKLPFIKSKQESEDLVNYLEKRNVFAVVFEYQNEYWIRLCIQVFVSVTNVVKLTKMLMEYRSLIAI